MVRLSLFVRQRGNLKRKGLSFTQTLKLLMNEDVIVCSKNQYEMLAVLSYNWPCESETCRWQERKGPYWIF